MTGQDAVKAWAVCSWRPSCTSDRGLMCDFHLITTQVALRMHPLRRCAQIGLRWRRIHTLAFTVAESVAFMCPSYLPLWFCESVSCADLSRLLPQEGGCGSLRGHRTGAGAGLLLRLLPRVMILSAFRHLLPTSLTPDHIVVAAPPS